MYLFFRFTTSTGDVGHKSISGIHLAKAAERVSSDVSSIVQSHTHIIRYKVVNKGRHRVEMM